MILLVYKQSSFIAKFGKDRKTKIGSTDSKARPDVALQRFFVTPISNLQCKIKTHYFLKIKDAKRDNFLILQQFSVSFHFNFKNSGHFCTRLCDYSRFIQHIMGTGRFIHKNDIRKYTSGWIFTKLFTQICKNFCNFRP